MLKKLFSIIIGALCFLLIGEFLIRLDESVGPFAKDNQVRIAIKLQESPELKMVKANNLPIDDSTYRILIIGDSYIYGAGISDQSKFSNLLKANLLKTNRGKYKRCLVLDVSRPSNNTLDNFNTYKQFSSIFKPELVILAYNLNDVVNNLDVQDTIGSKLGELPVKQKKKLDFVRKLYDILYTSHLIQFVMHNINDYLKGMGYIIPNSVFDQQLQSYILNRPNWVKSKAILNNLINETGKMHQKLLVIRMPEYNLLDHQELFKQTNSITRQFFTSHKNIDFIDPLEYYKGLHSKDLRLNKYDGHPNDRAHQILAKGLVHYINANYVQQ